ncbi:hypothetical protein DFP72DRAFT_884022 [Ephemerocybe angulata]|uniref:Uncharacterized protein n=1 Tax=Ephemerocybe angulata TaxID=980116 RepID=A0A8H6M8G8_9AGAR|nr:hypothetical protein DFP72DRAFT_884022 [Tulosesus angulatus]
MAAPTQEYPPWLSPSAVTSTNAAGEVVTSTTVVYLPITYLGPSIPLNSLYTYGGSTYPPTIVLPGETISTTASPPPPPTATTTSTSATTTPATPPTSTTVSSTTSTTVSTTSTSSSSSSSSSSTASTTSSSTTSSSSSTTSSTNAPTTSSGTTSTTPLPTGSSSSTSFPTTSVTTPTSEPTSTSGSSVGALSRGQLVGVIVASILGLIFLFVFLLAFWLWCKGRRNRRSAQFSTITPLDDDYFIVGEEARTPGEGSPRHSGEEADPFLQRSGAPSGGMQETATELGTRPGVPRVPPPVTNSMSSSGSSSNNSGYGVLLERPTLGILPPTVEEGENPFDSGYLLSEDEMREIERESVLPPDDANRYSGAYAYSQDPELVPPRLVDPDNAFSHTDIPRPPQLPFLPNHRFSAQSAASAADAEDAALLTARRVKVGDLPSAGSNNGSPSQTRSSFLDAIGLTGLTGLGRLSWFNTGGSGDSQRHSGRYSPTFTPEPKRTSRRQSPTGFSPLPLSDQDVENSRGLLQPQPQGTPDIDSFGRVRAVGLGVGTDGLRPVSNVSAKSGTSASGATIWHDARTSPGTPGFPDLSVPSRMGTPAAVEPAFPAHAWLPGGHPVVPAPLHSPPPYSDDPFVDTSPPRDVAPGHLQMPTSTSTTTEHGNLDDILDLPAPTALTHFTSSSSMRDSTTVSSIGLSRNPFPPGLDYEPKKPHMWTPEGSLSAASAASSPLWHNVTHGHGSDVEAQRDNAVVDILEEEPPDAQGGWRNMATGGISELGRRTTFGLPQYIHPGFIASEQGSLHSMRSHLNPPSIRSTGSAPASVSIRGGRSATSSSLHSGSLSSTSSGHRSIASASSSLAHSLVRSGSIITDGRRRFDPRIQASSAPPLSAFGSGGFLTPPRTAASSALSVSSSSGGGALLGEGVFRDGEMPTIDGPQGVHFSPGKSTIRSVNSGSTYTATVPAGARARTISAVTFGSVRQGASGVGVAGASPVESAEEGDLGLVNDRNAGGRLGSAWA